MIQTEAVAYTTTLSTKEGLQVDTLVLPGTNPGKTLILCHGAGKGKDYFTKLDASFAFAPTAKLQIMIPNSAHHEKWKKGMKTPWFTKRKSGSVETYNNYKEWSVEESADAIARIVMGEVKRYAKLYKETEKKAAKRVFLAGQSQGAMTSLYVQLTKLNVDLGGVMLHSGSFVGPLQKILDG